MKAGIHQTRIHQARIHRLQPFYRKTNQQFHRDTVQNTEAIGHRLIQLMMAKFHCILCDKDVSENNLKESKQLFQKLRQIHQEHSYRKQSSSVDHNQCRTLDDICLTLHRLRFWRSRLEPTKQVLVCLLMQSLCDLDYLLLKMYLSQYCDVCNDISELLWQLDRPSAADEMLGRLRCIRLRLEPAEGSFREICNCLQGLDLTLDLNAFMTCLQKISTLKVSDDGVPSYGTVVDNTHTLFSHLNINDCEFDNLLVDNISKINVVH